MRRDRRTLWILGLVLFASYAYFYQAGGWNQNSRFALVRAILERHTLQIDAYQLHTGDRAIHDGHYYSDKAPGQSLMALPAAALARAMASAVGVDPLGFAGLAWISYVSAAVTAGLFTVGAALVVFAITRRWGYSRGAAIFAATGYGLATPAWCYATLFMAHGVSAGCLVLALWLTIELEGADARRRRDVGVVIGLALGWAVVSEFQAAIPAAAIGLFTLQRSRALPDGEMRTVIVRVIVAGAACAVVLGVYNALAFGSPFHLGYQSEEGFEHLREGVLGVSTPQLWRVRELLVGSYRGLLPLAPLVALTPIGFAMAAAEPRRRTGALVAAFIGVYYLVLNASYFYWEGGWAFAPRQLMTAMPFVALGFGPLWDGGRRQTSVSSRQTSVSSREMTDDHRLRTDDRRLKWIRPLLAACWIWGAAAALIGEATNPQPPSSFKAPFRELLWPAFLDGDLSLNTQTMVHSSPPGGARPEPGVPRAAWNLGEIAGLRGHASLVPLVLVWVGGGVLLLRQKDR